MYRETEYGAKLRDNKEQKVCRDIKSMGHVSVRERDRKVFKGLLVRVSLRVRVCEFQVFVKLSFRSMRMEEVKRAM
jgi:hypothetical protein